MHGFLFKVCFVGVSYLFVAMNDNKLVAVVRAGDKPSTGLHVERRDEVGELLGGEGVGVSFFMNGRVGHRKLCWVSLLLSPNVAW